MYQLAVLYRLIFADNFCERDYHYLATRGFDFKP